MTLNYKDAGVDVEAGDRLVEWIQQSQLGASSLATDLQASLVSGVGGFAAITRIAPFQLKKPCLVTCTDGVGTKVKLASYFGDYSTVGQDLVAMCVNDLITCGGRPLYFLDYYATGKLNLSAAQEFLTSVKRACAESECLLSGGETAEMPGLYEKNDFDCAGFASGLVDEDEIRGPHRVQIGDVVIGIESSGFHSNGFSLLRRVFESDLDTWRDALLRPTALYPRVVKSLLSRLGNDLHSMAHITGGGMENLPRALPKGTQVKIAKWEMPRPFQEVQARAGISELELLKTLNCGIGYAVIVSSNQQQAAQQIIQEHGFRSISLGLVQAAAGQEAHVDYSFWGGGS